MTTDDAKTYLSKREIPRLFESLMTGLMYHRPSDHIKYLIDCLQKVHDKGQENITWSSFVDIRRTKTPLPPISGNEKRRPSSKGSSRAKTPKEESAAANKPEPGPRTSPLPDIPKAKDKLKLPDIPIVLVMGAPGSQKDKLIQDQVLARYPGWKFLNTGNLIKEEISRRGEANQKWKMTHDLLSRGEVAPEDVTIDVLLDALRNCKSAKGVVISGFPRNMVQVSEYQKQVCRVDTVFMIDCDESAATERLLRRGKSSNKPEDSMSAIATRLNYFKAHTLAAAKYFDDQGKLIVIDGDSPTASYDLGKAFDNLFLTSNSGAKSIGAPPKSASSVPPPSAYKKQFESDDEGNDDEEKPLFVGAVPEPPVISVQDTGRKPGLPTAPIVFIAGGPGSGKGTQCARILKRYPDMVHLSMGDIIRDQISTKGTADAKWGMITQLVSKGEMAPEDVTIDLLKAEIMKHKDAKAYLIEGFPRNKEQVEAFYNTIGGLNFVVLFDSDEYYMQVRLLKRGKESGRIDDNLAAISRRIEFYKYNTLPVMKYFDDQEKLVVLDSDRDLESMFIDISTLFDFAFFGRKPGDAKENKASSSKETSSKGPCGDDVDAAAVKIQAGFRGYMVRKQTNDTQGSKSDQAPVTNKQTYMGSNTMTVSRVLPMNQQGAKSVIKAGFLNLKTSSKGKASMVPPEAKSGPGNTTKAQGHSPDKGDKSVIQAGFINLKKSNKDKQAAKSGPAKPLLGPSDDKGDKSVIQAGFINLKKAGLRESKSSSQTTGVATSKLSEAFHSEVSDKEAKLLIKAGFTHFKKHKSSGKQSTETK